MNIYFKEDNLWVFVTQCVEYWSYSGTRLTPGERRKSMAEIYYSPTTNTSGEALYCIACKNYGVIVFT